jgi:hypothetical protein
MKRPILQSLSRFWTRAGTGTVAGATILLIWCFARLWASPNDPFSVLTPVKINGGWRISWQSVSNGTYVIQRAANDQLNASNWVDMATVTATNVSMFYDDLTTAARRFYRVKILGASPQFYAGDPDYFVAVGSGGQASEGSPVPISAGGQLSPFQFRPGGRSLVGAGQGIAIAFPQGARILTNDGAVMIEFSTATASFGPNSAFQFATNLSIVNASPRQIPIANLDVATLAAAFGLPPAGGLPVVLFGRFPILLMSGIFQDTGLRGGRISLPGLALPMPGLSGTYPDFVIDITPKGGLRIPFAGQFAMPDKSDFPPTLTIATNRPVWVEFKPGGEIALGGRADLAFSNGPSFTVDFGFDDPHYYLQMAATGVHLPLLSSLADLLPSAPTVPNTTVASQLDAARAQLGCFDSAMLNFNAASAGAAPASFDNLTSAPAQAANTAASVLEAWGYAGNCGGGFSLTSLSGAFNHASQVAASANDLKGALEQRCALFDIKVDAASGNISGDTSELDAAISATADAVVAHAGAADAVDSLTNLVQVMTCLLEIEKARQQIGLTLDPRINPAMQGALEQFLDGFTASLGVQAGVFTPQSGTTLGSLNQYAALTDLQELVAVMTIAQQLGLDAGISAPIQETLSQLALQLWNVVNTELTAAEAQGDYSGFTFALEDALELVRLRQSGIFPQRPDLAGIPDQSALNGFAQRLGAVNLADARRATGNRSLDNLRKDAARLEKILGQLPPGYNYPLASFQSLYNQIETQLGAAFANLNGLSLSDLSAVLEAGISQAQLRDLFSYPAPVSWENTRLPAAVSAFSTRALGGNSWSELHDAVGLLLAEADRQSGLGNQTRRQLYLAQAAQLLATARAVATAVWQNESAWRTANPLLQVADVVLPGAIYVNRVAGAVSYDRLSQELSGAFSGDLQMPKFNLSLTVDNASFSSAGEFDLNAHGQVTLPPGGSTVTLTIPARRPLRISYRAPNRISLSAGLRMAMANGMSLESFVSLSDPIYSFGLAAEGVRFDMSTNALIMIPTFPNAPSFGPNVIDTLNEYYQGLSAAVDSLSGLTNGLALGTPGTPPQFQESTVTFATAPLLTFANNIFLDLTNNLTRDYSAATNAVIDQLKQLAADTRSQRDQLEHSEVFLRGKVLQSMCSAGQLKLARAPSALDVQAILNSAEYADYASAAVDAATRLAARRDTTLARQRAEVLEAMGSVYVGAQCSSRPDLTTQLLSASATFLNTNLGAMLDDLGIDAATGQPNPNSTNFANLSPAKLQDALTNVFQALQIYQQINYQPNAVEAAARQTIAMRYRELMIQNLASLSVSNAAQHADIGKTTIALMQLEALRIAGGFDYPATPILQLDGTMQVTAGGSQAELQGNFMGKINQYADYLSNGGNAAILYFQSLPKKYRDDPFGLRELAKANAAIKNPTPLVAPTSGLAQMLNRTFAIQLADVQSALQSQWTTERMSEGVDLLDRLVSLENWAQNYNPGSLPAISNLIVTNLTVKMIGSAQAKSNAWLLNQYISLALTAATNKVANDANVLQGAFFGAATNSLFAVGGIINSLKNLLPAQRPYDLQLPGNVVVRRAAGSITYNRLTADLEGSFSGRLEFPDLQNAFFEINSATLDNHLNFSINADSRGPLPFNGLTLSASIIASNSPGPNLYLAGSGTLALSNGPALNANLTFDTASRQLAFNTEATNLSRWRFTDDLVLFNSGFGFVIRPDAQSGLLTANGSAGFFARGALPDTNSPLSQTNFYLYVDNLQSAIALQPGRADLTFSNGTLHLPAFFYPTNMAALCPGTGPATGPLLSLTATNPVRVTFLDGNPPAVNFSGELDFRQFGLAVPDIPNLNAALCSAKLIFPTNQLPYLTNVVGSLQIPIPGQTNFVDLTNGAFSMTGYPSGRIFLARDLTVLNLSGFQFMLLGAGNSNCPTGSGLTVFPSSGFNTPPSFQLDGGFKVIAPLSMLTDGAGDQASGLACGVLTMTNNNLPSLQLTAVQFGGTFHLGSDGPIITNALLTLSGLQNLFNIDSQHTFNIQLQGGMQIPNGPLLSMQGAQFTFFDPNKLPQFSISSLTVDNRNFTLLQNLPAQLTKGQITFLSPQAQLPELLAPSNVNVVVSAQVRFPPTGDPVLIGAVDNLAISFDANGLPYFKGIDGFDMGVGGLKLPPIKEMGGRIHVGGLSSGDPSKIYMVGRLGGSANGYTLTGQFAANLFGPLGFCIDVNAGAVGIPIGPTGILITGASGGESFVNSTGDPCAFSTYFTRDANGNLIAQSSPTPPGMGMTWEALRDVTARMEQEEHVFLSNVPGLANPGVSIASKGIPSTPHNVAHDVTSGLPCPGDCPPATVDIFCQPHPDQAQYPGKIIAKFSSINEATLNAIGITPTSIQGAGNNLATIADNVSLAIRNYVLSVTPPPDPSLLGPSASTALGAVITNAVNGLQSTASNLFYLGLASPQAGETYYATIRRLVYEGLPCPDCTMTAAANVSYTGVSSVAYVGGKVLLSTAGAAGVIGTIYVIGVPFGQAKVFVAATDANGDPNPSICGQVTVGLGPLDFGEMKVAYECPGCITGVVSGLPAVLNSLSDAVLSDVVTAVNTNLAAGNLTRPQLIAALLALPLEQRLGMFARLADEPASALPVNLPQVFFQGISTLYDSINPELLACGDVQPKIFGLPLCPDLVSARIFANKTQEAGSFQFSPSLLLGAYLPILPVGDTATLSFSLAYPDEYAFLFGGLAGGFAPENAVSYTQSAIDYSLENTGFGISYQIHPFGMDLLSTAGRAVLPDLTTHPALPWSAWVRPEDRGNTNLPSRWDLLIAAVATNALGDAATWRGTTNDLYTIYPPGSPQRAALAGLSLSKDYFPHGGVLGAAQLLLPVLLTEQPPLDKINTVTDAAAPPVTRILTAIDLVQNYVLKLNTNGELAFYVPAPNPPIFYDSNGQLLGQSQLQSITAAMHPQDVLNAIKTFDAANIHLGSIYPVEQAFLNGYLDGNLLGVPVVHASVVGLPADSARSAGYLSITSAIPNGSWLQQFVPQASLNFDVRGVPSQPIDQKFGDLLAQMQSAVDTNASSTAMLQLLTSAAIALTNGLPKVLLTANLALTSGLLMPSPVSDFLTFTGDAHLSAFSPKYDPTYQPANTGPLATAQREGGIAFQGAMNLTANGSVIASIPNAELSVVPQASGLPNLSGTFNLASLALPGLSVNNAVVNFSSTPNPQFSVTGSIASPAIGLFGIQPLGVGALGGLISVARTGPQAASISATLAPAQLTFPSLYTNVVLIHGPARQDFFTFSTSGPWSATLEMTNGLNLLNIVQIASSGLGSPITLQGNGVGSASVTVSFNSSAAVTLFPGNANLQRSFTLPPGATGSARVSSDGSFLFNAIIGGSALSFNGIAVPAGASLTASNGGVAITWTVNNSTATASLVIPANGGPITFSGNAELPPLHFGIFTISGAGGGNLQGTFNNDGFAITSGAKLTLAADWLQNQSLTLNTFTMSNNGGMQVTVSTPGNSLLFAGYPFDLTSFSLQRFPTNGGNGAASLALAGNLRVNPNFAGFPSVAFNGSVSSSGAVTLSASGGTSFFGFPVRGLTNYLALLPGQYVGQLSTGFSLGDNSAPLWNQLATNWFTGNLNPDGSFALSADVPGLGVAGFSLGNVLFRCQRIAGQSPVVTLEGDFGPPGFSPVRLSGGVSTAGGIFLVPAPPAPAVPLPYPNLDGQVSLVLSNTGASVSGTLHQSPLPPLALTGAIQTSGTFKLTTAVTPVTVNGFNLGGAQFTLQRVDSVSPPTLTASGSLAVPGIGNFTINGGFTNNGTFGFATTIPGNTALAAGLPVSTVNNAALTWTQTGLTLNGVFSGGVLTQVGLAAGVTAAGSVTVAPGNGAQTISASVAIQPIVNNQFTIAPSAGASLAATLDNNGLTVAGGAVLTCGNNFSAGVPLPAVTIQPNGNFSVAVGNPRQSVQIKGYSMDNVQFLLQRTSGTVVVTNLLATLNIPGLNASVAVSGGLNSDGTFSLSGTLGNAVNLNGLPVTSLAANANVTLDQNGLRIVGSVAGSMLANVGQPSAGATLYVGSNGSIQLGGSVTLAPLSFGAFQISSGGGNISVVLTNAGLKFPPGLQLQYNGAPLTSATLPAFTNDSNGNLGFALTGVAATVGGFAINAGTLGFQVSAGVAGATINAGALSVPGFSPALIATMAGTLQSDATFSLSSSSAVGGTFTPSASGLPFGAVSAISSVTLDNTSLRLNGTLSGAALATINSGITASGILVVDKFGNITPSAVISVNALLLADNVNGFQLAPLSGASFQATLGPAGITFPAGARVSYRGASLGSFTLPAFTIGATGSFSASPGTVGVSLSGYNLSANLTLARGGGVTTLRLNSGSSLALPGLGGSVSVTGAVTNNGTFLINGATAVSFTLPNLPAATLNSSASAVFVLSNGVAGLTLSGTLSGGALDSVQAVTASGVVGITASGVLSLSGNLQIAPINAGFLTIEGPNAGANISASWSSSYLTLSGARLRSTQLGFLDTAISLPAIQIPANGQFTQTVPSSGSINGINVGSFPFNSVSFTLSRLAPNGSNFRDLSIGSFAGNLGLTGFGQHFANGSISSGGTPSFSWSGSLTLPPSGGFTANYASLQLNGSGLLAVGTFALTVQGNTIGSVPFRGFINTSGGFNLATSGSWSLSNLTGLDSDNSTFSTQGNGSLTFTSSGITGNDTLSYGSLNLPISITALTPGGISFSGSKSLGTGSLVQFLPPPPAPCAPGAVYGGLNVSATLSASGSNGSFHAGINGQFGFWVTVLCNNVQTDFSKLPGSQIIGVSQSIKSDGVAFINQTEGAQHGFTFHLW